MSYAHTKGPETHNNPKKYYFCDKLGFDVASILVNNFYMGWFIKGGVFI